MFQIEDSVETDTGYFEMQPLVLFAGLIKDETLWEYSDIVTYQTADEVLVWPVLSLNWDWWRISAG